MSYFRGIFGFTACDNGCVSAPCDWCISCYFFLCLWFNRLGYRKADSFCSDKRRPLRSRGSVRVYAAWRTKGRVPYWVGVFLVENYWSSHSNCDPSTNSFSQRTLLCGSWEDKTCFMVVKAPPTTELGHQWALFPNLCYSFKDKVPSVPEADIWGDTGGCRLSGECWKKFSALKLNEEHQHWHIKRRGSRFHQTVGAGWQFIWFLFCGQVVPRLDGFSSSGLKHVG